MKKKATKRRKKNPEHEIHELILFAENEYNLHNQFLSIMKNLSRKYKHGIYDPKLAAKLWKYWIDEAVKQYNKQILGGKLSLAQNVFTLDDRKKAAIKVEKQNRNDVFSGEYLQNPRKKVMKRKKASKKKRSAKQLANDKRLGRMAKARAKAKRGGRRKVVKKKASKKTASKNPRKTRPTYRKSKQATKAKKKNILWIVFRCKKSGYGTGASLSYLGPTQAGTMKFGPKSKAFVFFSSSQAQKLARKYSSKSFYVGVANKNISSAKLMDYCKGKV